MKKVMFLTAVLIVLLAAMPGCKKDEGTFTASLILVPTQMEDTVPGQSCVFLLQVTGEGTGAETKTAELSAIVSAGEVSVQPESISLGQVAEITVIPDAESVGGTIVVTITGKVDTLQLAQTATLVVNESPPGLAGLARTAASTRNRFTAWLASNQPELRITGETEWTGTIVRPSVMGAAYYLYFSDDWEMGVSWSISPAPNDWARIYLRDRTTETTPSLAFELPSVSAGGDIQSIDPPEAVWR